MSEKLVILVCDGHAALYDDGKKVSEGGAEEMTRDVLLALGCEMRALDDDAIDGQFPDVLP